MASPLPLSDSLPSQQKNGAIGSINVMRNGLYTLFAFLTASELLFLILFRKVNLDEGWYLWAGKLVMAGKLLYRDFVYTQTPLLPYVYGISQQLLGEGLYQGRMVTSLFTVLTILLCTFIVYRRAEQIAPAAALSNAKEEAAEQATGRQNRQHLTALTFLLLFGTSFYALAYLTYTATYALATFLMISSLAVVVYFGQSREDEMARNILATVLLVTAVATRLSILAAAPPLLLFLIYTSRRRLRAFVWIAVSGSAALFLLLGSFWLLSDGMLFYDIFGFHTDRILSLERQIKKMLRVLGESALIYLIPILLSTIGASKIFFRARRSSIGRGILRPYLFEWLLVSMIVLLLAMHLIPRTTASYYNTLQAPLLCMLGAFALAQWLGRDAIRGRGSTHVALALAAIATHATINGVALFYFDLLALPPINQIAVVKDAAAFLRRIELPSDTLLTLNTHLALEAGMNVPTGYEMSIFSYRPDWTTARAQQFNAVNNELLIEDLLSGAGEGMAATAVALTEWDKERFFGDREQIFDALGHYRLVKTVPNFDPFYNNLYIYLPPQIQHLEPENVLPIEFEGRIQFLGYDVERQSVRMDHEAEIEEVEAEKTTEKTTEKIYVGLYWQAPEKRVPLSYTGFAQLISADGQLITGWDNPPCHRTCPTESWRPNEVLRDEYILSLPEGLEPGIYTIQVGMYSSDNGAPLPIITRAATVIDNRIVITQIEIE